MTSLDETYYSLLPEVAEALEHGKPIVALESTVITHGLPFPDNQQLASEVEREIREVGCVPATIAILDGKICLGIDQQQLEQLVQAKELLKVSVRDIAIAVSARKTGGTTVAGTLAVAQAAGIKVFATGGIGGVHRGSAFDVSADLQELRRAQLVVVCAGAKAILDIPATLEVLETLGVPVIGYQTDHFPGFYSANSGYPVSSRVDSPEEVAKLAQVQWRLGQTSAILVAVPPPAEIALRKDVVEAAIQTALEDVQRMNIHGQAVTPYLLRRVSEMTGGASLKANLGLLSNNARIAAQIAKAIYNQ